MRTPGYSITIKLFIPAPKTDFKAQAKAAELVGAVAETKTITPELIAVAKVTDVQAKFASAEVEETPPADTKTEDGGGDPPKTDEFLDGIGKRDKKKAA